MSGVEILRRELPRALSKAVLAVEPGAGHPAGGTLFLFNYLISAATAEDPDTFLTFVVTADAVTAGSFAGLVMPRHMVSEPDTASDMLAFVGWADQWYRPKQDGSDVALMPFAELQQHAASKGWHWITQEVTDGMLLGLDDPLDVYGDELVAYGYQ